MPSITVNTEEFADIVVAYLLEMLRDETKVPDNTRLKEVLNLMSQTGLKSSLYESFITMDMDTRTKYKVIKDAIHDKGSSNILINVGTVDSKSVEFDRELCKQIFRTIKEVRFKQPSKILREDRIDKIIDYCIEQKKKHTEEQNG